MWEQNGTTYVCQKVKSKHFTECDETIDERELAVDLSLFINSSRDLSFKMPELELGFHSAHMRERERESLVLNHLS